jgi:DNA-binding GntR family transcriptional regulator
LVLSTQSETNLVSSDTLEVPKPSHRERAYGVIRREICLGRIKHGTKINERVLAERLGMSRMPVREALLCLHGEGLVAISGNRGMKVAEMTPEEARQQVEFRTVIECAALEMACERITSAQIERLEDLLLEQEVLVNAKDWQAFRESDLTFHHLLLSAAGNKFISQMSGSLAMGSTYSPQVANDLSIVHSHRRILEAVRLGLIEDAKRLMHEHITGGPLPNLP